MVAKCLMIPDIFCVIPGTVPMGSKLDLPLFLLTTYAYHSEGAYVRSTPEWNRHHLSVRSTGRSQTKLLPSHEVWGGTNNNKIQAFNTGDRCFLLTVSGQWVNDGKCVDINQPCVTTLLVEYTTKQWYFPHFHCTQSRPLFLPPVTHNMVNSYLNQI